MQGGRVAPVQIGNVTITDTGSLQSIFPPAAVETIVKYFPTVGAPPITTIPDTDVPILVDAFKRRIVDLRGLTGQKVSTITDFKNKYAIREFMKVLAKLETKNLDIPYQPLKKAKEPRRKLFAKLKPDIQRELVFKILWDLFHPEAESGAPEDTWNSFIEEISKKSPLQIALENSKSLEPSGGKGMALDQVDMTGLTKATQGEGLTAFTGVTGVSGADQLKRLYAVLQLLNIDVTKPSQAHTDIIKKLETILNVYSVYYSTRFEKLIAPADTDGKGGGFITTFYKNNQPLISKLFNTIIRLYNIVSTIKKRAQEGGSDTLIVTLTKINISTIIKVKFDDTLLKDLKDLNQLITTYQDSLGGSKTRTNELAKQAKSDTYRNMLYNINILDAIAIKIIGKPHLTNIKDLDLRKITEDDYDGDDKSLYNENKSKILDTINNYFKGDNHIYLIANISGFGIGSKINTKIGNLCTYDVDTQKISNLILAPLTIPPPILVPYKKSVTRTSEEVMNNPKEPIVKIEYRSTELFNSVTPAILALLAIEHLKAQIKPAAK